MKNVYSKFHQICQDYPQKVALIIPAKYSCQEYNYQQIQNLTASYQYFFKCQGIAENDHVAVFLRPGIEFIATTFALFSMGAIPVFMDPGMGLKKILSNLKSIKIKFIIAESIVLFILFFLPKIVGVKLKISKRKLKSIEDQKIPITKVSANTQSAILFTSGATGPSKGVCYTHEMFLNQISSIQSIFKIKHTDIDYPAFPLFSLFTLCMGATVVIPTIDPSRPSSCKPRVVLGEIKKYQATIISGSPAIWDKVSKYQKAHPLFQDYTNKIKTVIMFGAPVSYKIYQNFLPFLPSGDIFTPYGATESLPVCVASAREILAHHLKDTLCGAGTFIGKPLPGVKIKIIPFGQTLIRNKNLKDAASFGELWVASNCTSKEYYQLELENQRSKIKDDEGETWHKMGDLVTVDEFQNLWFQGRIPHSANINEKIFTSISCEAIFNQHPIANRSALIQLNAYSLAVVIESPSACKMSSKKRSTIKEELKQLAKKYSHTDSIAQFYLAKKFPVDIRHNIKINRELLREKACQGKLL